MSARWYSVFIGDKCIFDGPFYSDAAARGFANETAHRERAARVSVFRGKDIGRLIYETDHSSCDEDHADGRVCYGKSTRIGLWAS